MSVVRKLLLVFYLAVINPTYGLPQKQKLMHYTHKAKIEDYPYFAFLGTCGAAIISDRWLLTAAHCVNNKQYHQNFVEVGGETSKNSERVPYDRVEVYDDKPSNNSIPLHDIALIKLSRPLKLSEKVKPVALPRADSVSSPLAVFAGRGENKDKRPSKILLRADFVRLTSEQCIKEMPRRYQEYARRHQLVFEKTFICARRQERNKPSLCYGDSGSPLVSDNTVIGLASFIGRPCHKARLGFFVNVANYVPWIKSVTGI